MCDFLHNKDNETYPGPMLLLGSRRLADDLSKCFYRDKLVTPLSLLFWNPSAVGCAGVFPRKEDVGSIASFNQTVSSIFGNSWANEVQLMDDRSEHSSSSAYKFQVWGGGKR